MDRSALSLVTLSVLETKPALFLRFCEPVDSLRAIPFMLVLSGHYARLAHGEFGDSWKVFLENRQRACLLPSLR